MITAIEYRIQCDNGAQCADSNRFIGVGAQQVILANSGGIARDKAKLAGWVRRAVKLPNGLREMRDLCPDCAKPRS